MADRSNYFSGQKVKFTHMRQTLDDVERADHAIMTDAGTIGVLGANEYVLSEASPASLLVDVSGGVAYDKTGRRVEMPSDQQANFAVDDDNVSTAVLVNGNERWVSLFVRFARLESDTQGPDLNNDFVEYRSEESFELYCVAGAEATISTAVKPSLDPEDLLLGEVLLVFGQTTIVNAQINTDRREWVINAGSDGGFKVEGGDPIEVLHEVIDAVDSLVTGGGPVTVPAASVSFDPTGLSWVAGAFVAVQVQTAIAEIINTLKSVTTSSSGARRTGVEAITTGTITIAAGSLLSVLQALAQADKLYSLAEAGSPSSLAQGSIRAQAVELLGFVNARVRKVGDTMTGNLVLHNTGPVLVTYSAARSYSATVPLVPIVPDASKWDLDPTTGLPRQIDVVVGALYIYFKLPTGATLKEIIVRINPADTHVAAPAAFVNVPRIWVQSIPHSTGVPGDVLGPYEDNDALSQAAYEASHTFTSGTITLAIDNAANAYRFRILGEEGSSARVDMILQSILVTYEMTGVPTH